MDEDRPSTPMRVRRYCYHDVQRHRASFRFFVPLSTYGVSRLQCTSLQPSLRPWTLVMQPRYCRIKAYVIRTERKAVSEAGTGVDQGLRGGNQQSGNGLGGLSKVAPLYECASSPQCSMRRRSRTCRRTRLTNMHVLTPASWQYASISHRLRRCSTSSPLVVIWVTRHIGVVRLGRMRGARGTALSASACRTGAVRCTYASRQSTLHRLGAAW